MAESERTPHVPPLDPSPTAGDTPVRILDVSAILPTGAYPFEGTATFAPAPAAEGLATAAVGPLDDTDTEPAEHLPQITGYRVLRVVSSGGMGTVFKAVHLGLNKVIALKLINSGWAADNDFRVRFEREAKTLGRLDHPNVVPVYDAGSWQGLPYLTMKYIAGKTLHHNFDNLRRDLTAAARVLAQVARAVAYLHSQNIIHRDLKPLNILMTLDGVPLVADFGLVRPLTDDSELSLTFVPLGTRPYMSPEQTRGGRENYTPACDIWALGVILYELLAGARPFAHDDPDELFRLIRNDPVPPIDPALGVPPGLETIARKCLQKDPADRYACATDLADDLDRWLAGGTVEPARCFVATPPPAAAMIETSAVSVDPTKPRSRGRVLLGGAAVALALLVAGSAWAFRDRQPVPAPTPAPAPVGPKTIAERLQRGETVVLVGKDGMPVEPYRVLPGFTGEPTTQRDGHLTLNSFDYGAVELACESLPWPVRLEAEVATRGQDEHSWAGLYGGRKVTPGGPVPHNTMFVLTQSAKGNLKPTGTIDLVETAAARFMSWKQTPSVGVMTEHSTVTRTSVVSQKDADATRWRDFAIDLDPDSMAPRWDGRSPVALTGREALNLCRYDVAREALKPAIGPPAFGDGLGICVFKAEATYRNVRLVPIRK